MAIVPLGNRVLIEPRKLKEFKTESGIFIGDVPVPQSTRAEIIALGDEVKGFEVGDVIFVSQFAPTGVQESAAHETMVVPTEDILAKLVKD